MFAEIAPSVISRTTTEPILSLLGIAFQYSNHQIFISIFVEIKGLHMRWWIISPAELFAKVPVDIAGIQLTELLLQSQTNTQAGYHVEIYCLKMRNKRCSVKPARSRRIRKLIFRR